MGNVQTPLLQFPNVFFYTSAMRDLDYLKRSEREVLLDVSGYLYPENKELLTDAYLALKDGDPTKVAATAERLETLIKEKKLGQPGIFGRKLFPEPGIVAQALVMQLRLRAPKSVLGTPDISNRRPIEGEEVRGGANP
jgi:hypothetical protein